jgi:hopene-associated glycosyltransferase HpnB
VAEVTGFIERYATVCAALPARQWIGMHALGFAGLLDPQWPVMCQASGMLGLAIACVISAVAWLYLVIAHGGYWLTSQRLPNTDTAAGDPPALESLTPAELPDARETPRVWPPVAAVVPARNEAEALPGTLPTLLAQEYPGEFTVFLVDDNSDDGTGTIAAELGEKATLDSGAKLTVVKGKPRPDGWAGKVWAMAQGLTAVTATSPADRDGGYVLFTDADIAWAPTALRDLVAAAEDDHRAMVSQLALLRAQTRWERLIVPAFVYFFAQLYPFPKVNSASSRTAAAAGGCMLVGRIALEQAGGLEPVKGALIDDVALGSLLKKNGNRIWLGLTRDIKSARPYPSLASLWHMIARSAYVQLRYNPLVLAGTLAGLLLLYVLPLAGLIAVLAIAAAGGGSPATGVAGVAAFDAWVLMSVSFLPTLRFYRLSPLRAPALPLIAALYAAMTADSARRHYSGKTVSWRGRTADRVD